MKSASSLRDVRENIDRVDRGPVALLTERERFVPEAARLERTAREVPALEGSSR